MKVLMINEECGTGSTGRICTDIAAALENEGNEVKIAFGRNADIVPTRYHKYAVRIGNDIDLKIHGVISRAFDATGLGSVEATKKFVRWVYEFDPDVIHLHNLHGYYINIKLLFECLKNLNRPVIWTLHDVWPFTGHSAYCDAVKCEKWKNGCGKCPQLATYPKSYIDRSESNWKRKKEFFCGLEKVTIVTPSEWLAQQVRESFLNCYPSIVINNGIDTSKFHPLENLKKPLEFHDKRVLLSVATVWNDLKGLGDFYKLAKLLDRNYRIVLVGGMTERQERDLPSNILHIKKTQDIDEMVELYNIAEAYINLTYCDTYPTVNLEAAACGTPVITYAVGGSTESAEMFGGLSVERGNIVAIAKAVQTVQKTKVKMLDINILDKKRSVQRYLNLYRGEI